MSANVDAAATSSALQAVDAAGDALEWHYAADTWHASVLGISAARGAGTVSFTGVAQPWLREAVKRWARQRLAIGCAFNTIKTARLAFVRFSAFLADRQPTVQRPEQLDRTLVERYLAWLAPQPLSESTKASLSTSMSACPARCPGSGDRRPPRSSRLFVTRTEGSMRSSSANRPAPSTATSSA